MEKIYERWKTSFFTETLLVAILVIGLCIALKYRKKYPILKYFPIYICSLLLVFLSIYVWLIIPGVDNYILSTFNFINYIDYMFILVELFIFSHFFYLSITNKAIKKIILGLSILFIPYFLFELCNDKFFPRSISEWSQSRVYTVESLILLIPCFVYFYELFNKPPVLNLKNEPSFWIVVGWSFFATCTLPYSLLENYLRKSYSNLMTQFYSVFYIFYTLLLITIIRAYLCKKIYT